MHYYEVCNIVFSRKYARIALHDAAMQFELKPAPVLVSTEQACASTRGNAITALQNRSLCADCSITKASHLYVHFSP
jgi:hypothetical protein